MNATPKTRSEAPICERDGMMRMCSFLYNSFFTYTPPLTTDFDEKNRQQKEK